MVWQQLAARTPLTRQLHPLRDTLFMTKDEPWALGGPFGASWRHQWASADSISAEAIAVWTVRCPAAGHTALAATRLSYPRPIRTPPIPRLICS